MPTRRELEKLRARHKGLHERYGRYCVFLDGRRVQCFRTEESAERVARGFGPGFRRKRETSDG